MKSIERMFEYLALALLLAMLGGIETPWGYFGLTGSSRANPALGCGVKR